MNALDVALPVYAPLKDQTMDEVLYKGPSGPITNDHLIKGPATGEGGSGGRASWIDGSRGK